MKEIPLTQGKVAIVDDEDFEQLNKYKWCYDGKYAARTEHKPHKVRMHRVILNTPVGMDTDHKNGNRLDNRRENLRVCTRSQNGANRSILPQNTSGFRGVYFDRRRDKWQAYIKKGGKRKHIGYFPTSIDAARAYDSEAEKLFGEFSRPNFRES